MPARSSQCLKELVKATVPTIWFNFSLQKWSNVISSSIINRLSWHSPVKFLIFWHVFALSLWVQYPYIRCKRSTYDHACIAKKKKSEVGSKIFFRYLIWWWLWKFMYVSRYNLPKFTTPINFKIIPYHRYFLLL